MAENRAVAYKAPGRRRGHRHRLPDVRAEGRTGGEPGQRRTEGAARRDPQDRRHQHLRLRPAHGARPHHRAGRTSCSDTRSPVRSSRSAPDVEFIKVGDIVSVPFNIACGRCRNCKERKTGICLNVNPDRPGSAYGYVDMGGWVGGQAEFVLVPYADWNLLKFPDRDQALEKIMDLTMLSDIFPTGFHGAVTAGVGVGSTVYVAGAGPVGLAAATGALLLGAAAVIVGDMNADRLAQARSFGCETVDLSEGEPASTRSSRSSVCPRSTAASTPSASRPRRVTAATRRRRPATVLNSLMDVTAAGGALGIPGLYVTGDPGGIDEAAQKGSLSLSLGTGWAKSLSFTTGQCPVMKYNHGLMQAILHDRVHIAKNVNAKAITLEDAPRGYAEFDAGAATKYVLNPNGYLDAA